MSKKSDLRTQRKGTVINTRSKRQEKELDKALRGARERLLRKFPRIELHHERQWLLKDVAQSLRQSFPEVDFNFYHDTSAMRPDGGILSIVAKNGARYPILIAEKKNQGTNDLRASEEKTKQAKEMPLNALARM